MHKKISKRINIFYGSMYFLLNQQSRGQLDVFEVCRLAKRLRSLNCLLSAFLTELPTEKSLGTNNLTQVSHFTGKKVSASEAPILHLLLSAGGMNFQHSRGKEREKFLLLTLVLFLMLIKYIKDDVWYLKFVYRYFNQNGIFVFEFKLRFRLS